MKHKIYIIQPLIRQFHVCMTSIKFSQLYKSKRKEHLSNKIVKAKKQIDEMKEATQYENSMKTKPTPLGPYRKTVQQLRGNFLSHPIPK